MKVGPVGKSSLKSPARILAVGTRVTTLLVWRTLTHSMLYSQNSFLRSLLKGRPGIQTGPFRLKPYWLYRNGFGRQALSFSNCGSLQGRAAVSVRLRSHVLLLSAAFRRYSYASPCKSWPPPLVTMRT